MRITASMPTTPPSGTVTVVVVFPVVAFTATTVCASSFPSSVKPKSITEQKPRKGSKMN